MGYGCGDSFPFDFEPNEIPFGSKLIGKLSPQLYPTRFEKKWKHSFLSVRLIPAVFFVAGMLFPVANVGNDGWMLFIIPRLLVKRIQISMNMVF